MTTINKIIIVLVLHWIADFICQTDSMAKNKSSSNKALLSHIAVYTLVMCLVGFKFALLNGVIHFAVDYCTSRVTKKLWAKQDVHNFFVVIGLDQLIHTITLITTIGLSIL